MRRKRVSLVQQGVWDLEATGRESMPLACGYLKATADADERLRSELDIAIHNFGGGATTLSIIKRLVEDPPDLLAFSVFGWSFERFGNVAETYRQLRPDGWVVMGGTHVTDQARRVFRLFPSVDVIVNGEGELTFRELLRAYLAGTSKHELSDIAGISFKTADGQPVTTASRGRIQNLDDIPSPFLSGAMELKDAKGEFKYDVALIETNRGCPYKCAFCYWGGAIGQKLRAFSLDRLQEEIELFARMGVVNIALCDANFGMTKEDESFLELLVRAREKHGYPRDLITSWAKNKGKPFYRIVRRMKQTGFHSSFTLALQTLHEPALRQMGRLNMKVNEWKDLAEWLHREGLDVYAELIWGCPGETYDSFLKGYDDLSASCARIATYPHLILPNTDYSERRAELGFVTWRTGKDDFEYVLSHNTMSFADNQRMHRFLFWARVVCEHPLLRYIWAPLRKLAGLAQSQVLLSLDRWIDAQPEPAAAALRSCRAEVTDHFDANRIARGLHCLYSEAGLAPLMERWWDEEILPRVPVAHAHFFRELFRYDWLTRPVLRGSDGLRCEREVDQASRHRFESEDYYVLDGVPLDYDIPALISRIVRGEPCDFTPRPHRRTLYFKVGFDSYVPNHEFYVQFVGKTEAQLQETALKVASEQPLPEVMEEVA